MREKYESLSAVVLRDLAKARGLKNISGMKKSDLVDLMVAEDERQSKEENTKQREQTSQREQTPQREQAQREQTPQREQAQQRPAREPREGRENPKESGVRCGRRSTGTHGGRRDTGSQSTGSIGGSRGAGGGREQACDGRDDGRCREPLEYHIDAGGDRFVGKNRLAGIAGRADRRAGSRGRGSF